MTSSDRFPVPVRSAVKSNLTDWCFQNLSKRALNASQGSIVFTVLRYVNSTRMHTFNGALSGTTQVSRYQKGKTNLDFTEARDNEWQWHQLGRYIAPDR